MADRLDRTGTGLGFLERILTLVSKYRIWDFAKAFVVLVMLAFAVGLISRPEWLFEQYEKWQAQQHTEMIEARTQNTVKINSLLDKSLYRIGADRIILCELHNGVTNLGGLSFAKATATFEVMREGIYPVSAQYQDINLSLMPISSYLSANGVWYGRTEDLKTIDRGLTYKMLSNGTEEFMAALIQGVNADLAIIFVSFNAEEQGRDWESVRQDVRHISMELALLLELNRKAY